MIIFCCKKPASATHVKITAALTATLSLFCGCISHFTLLLLHYWFLDKLHKQLEIQTRSCVIVEKCFFFALKDGFIVSNSIIKNMGNYARSSFHPSTVGREGLWLNAQTDVILA